MKRRLPWLVGIVILDQVSKVWAQGRHVVVMNRGGVFGLLPSSIWVVVLAVIWLFMVWDFVREKDWIKSWGLGLVVAGGLGNIIDRTALGAVRDFIYYPGFGFYGNVADIVLVFGVGLLLWRSVSPGRIAA